MLPLKNNQNCNPQTFYYRNIYGLKGKFCVYTYCFLFADEFVSIMFIPFQIKLPVVAFYTFHYRLHNCNSILLLHRANFLTLHHLFLLTEMFLHARNNVFVNTFVGSELYIPYFIKKDFFFIFQ